MANLKEVRLRIASVKSTAQITSAMKMVSAAKLRKSQSVIMKLRPYSKKMSDIMAQLGSNLSEDLPFARQTKNNHKNILIIALTSNKGLCGAFNSSIIKLTAKTIAEYQQNGDNVTLLSYGKKGDNVFKKMSQITYLGSNDTVWDSLNFEEISKEADRIINEFLQKKYDRIEIIYNQFKNAASQIATVENFLPLQIQQTRTTFSEKNNYKKNYIFSPSKEQIMISVIPQSLKTQLYKCFLDSFTSEHGARMSSMNKATDNAQALLKDLTLTYNKQRQADITNQIIEVSNGANAV